MEFTGKFITQNEDGTCQLNLPKELVEELDLEGATLEMTVKNDELFFQKIDEK